jgi:hypothetical protein
MSCNAHHLRRFSDIKVFELKTLKKSFRVRINIHDLERSKYRIMEATMTKEQLEQEIAALKDKLTGDMFQDMDIKDQIHNLEMKLNGVKPMDSHFDCVGCGS